MKILNFTPEKKQAFHAIYAGFLLGTPDGGLQGPAKVRQAVRIIDKFAAVAKSDDQYQPGEVRAMTRSGDLLLDLRDEGGEVVLEDAEFAMLKVHLNNCPWTAGGAKMADEAFNMIESVE